MHSSRVIHAKRIIYTAAAMIEYIHDNSKTVTIAVICTASGPTYNMAVDTAAVFNAKMAIYRPTGIYTRQPYTREKRGYTRLTGLNIKVVIYTAAVVNKEKAVYTATDPTNKMANTTAIFNAKMGIYRAAGPYTRQNWVYAFI